MSNYEQWPLLWIFPIAGVLGALISLLSARFDYRISGFLGSGLAVAMIILTAGASMFPFVMPSSLDPNSSLTAWDVVASHKSLGVMFWVVLIFLPIILIYTSWIYRIMRGKIDADHIAANEHSAY